MPRAVVLCIWLLCTHFVDARSAGLFNWIRALVPTKDEELGVCWAATRGKMRKEKAPIQLGRVSAQSGSVVCKTSLRINYWSSWIWQNVLRPDLGYGIWCGFEGYWDILKVHFCSFWMLDGVVGGQNGKIQYCTGFRSASNKLCVMPLPFCFRWAWWSMWKSEIFLLMRRTELALRWALKRSKHTM